MENADRDQGERNMENADRETWRMLIEKVRETWRMLIETR